MNSHTSRFTPSYIFAISFISALGGYLFGFDFAVISGALPFLKFQFDMTEYWEGFATGVLALGAILGSSLAGRIAQKHGRRTGLMVAAAVFAISSIGMALSPNREVFCGTRFFAGIGVGMASMLSPLYIAEIAPPQTRGRMVSLNQLTIVFGILFTNIINYSLKDKGVNAWRWMVGLGVVPSSLFLAGVFWLPESPRWLLQKGDETKALKILEKTGGLAYATETIRNSKRSSISVNTGITFLLKKRYLPILSIGVILAVFQQLCGINVVFNYTSILYESLGFTKDNQLLETVFIGGANLVFTLLSMALIDRVGRKPMMLIGSLGLAVTHCLVAFLLGIKSPLVSWFLLASIALYATSLGPVTWVLISEIFPNSIRASATALAVVFLWSAYFILTFTFPILYSLLLEKTFFIYSGICIVGFLLVWKKVKETKGISLDNMDGLFAAH